MCLLLHEPPLPSQARASLVNAPVTGSSSVPKAHILLGWAGLGFQWLYLIRTAGPTQATVGQGKFWKAHSFSPALSVQVGSSTKPREKTAPISVAPVINVVRAWWSTRSVKPLLQTTSPCRHQMCLIT